MLRAGVFERCNTALQHRQDREEVAGGEVAPSPTCQVGMGAQPPFALSVYISGLTSMHCPLLFVQSLARKVLMFARAPRPSAVLSANEQ